MKAQHQFTADGSTSYTMPVAFIASTVEVVVNRVTVYDNSWIRIQGKTLAFTANVPTTAAIVRVSGEVAR